MSIVMIAIMGIVVVFLYWRLRNVEMRKIVEKAVAPGLQTDSGDSEREISTMSRDRKASISLQNRVEGMEPAKRKHADFEYETRDD